MQPSRRGLKFFSARSLTSDGAEGVEVLGGEQGGRQLPDELLEQRRGVVGAHLVPADVARVEVGLQVLLQQLRTQPEVCHFIETAVAVSGSALQGNDLWVCSSTGSELTFNGITTKLSFEIRGVSLV